MPFEIKKATREGIKPLIGLYGKSGSGKTHSALLLARGIVGPQGRITLIDTESRRGSLFADIIPGGYNVIDFDPPFTPKRYSEAFTHAEKNSDIIVTDSLTHLWDGEGGILEMQEAELDRMAGDDLQKRERCKMAAWIKPKMQLKRLTQGFLLRSPLPIICCLRSQDKTHVVERNGKKEVITDDRSSPIFDHRFIFELLLNGEVVERDGKGGFFVPTKITHPALAPFLPKPGEQISVATGEAIGRWCQAATSGSPKEPTQQPVKAKSTTKGNPTPTSTPPNGATRALGAKDDPLEQQVRVQIMRSIYDLTTRIHKVPSVKPTEDEKRNGKIALQQYLWDEGFMDPNGETLDGASIQTLNSIAGALKKRTK
jgi:hypothetical protein